MKPVFLQLQCTPGKTYEVADTLFRREIVSELYSTSGEFDLLAKIYVTEGDDIGKFIRESGNRPAVANVRTNFSQSLSHVDVGRDKRVNAVRIFTESFGYRILDRSDLRAFHFLVDIDPDDGVFAEDDAVGVLNAFDAAGERFKMGRNLLRIAR